MEMTNHWISKTYEITISCWTQNITLLLFAWKATQNTPPTAYLAIHTFIRIIQCIQRKKKKKTASQEKHVAELQHTRLVFLGLRDSHQSWSLSSQKWNCTYLRNRNYAGFCEPFFPISDLWMCGMTPAMKTHQ